MLNFAVGPVMSPEEVLAVAAQPSPYFRTSEFSTVMLENERMMLELFHAPADCRCVFLTASGTGAMESVVMNVLSAEDTVIVINGGSFGQRFADLCRLHHRSFTEVRCDFGKQLRQEQLLGLESHTALLINMHETSSGLLYDMAMVSDFCRENHILLIVDAISAFLADALDMEQLGAAVVITGSQKALALHPGVSIVALNPDAQARVCKNPEVCMYLSLKEALKNGDRGQTPFTPAVSVLLQLHRRLRDILIQGGASVFQQRTKALAHSFREGIQDLPLHAIPEAPSNALTALHPSRNNAQEIVDQLKNNFSIWVCPNGGAQADYMFRVGHIGEISTDDNRTLLDALHRLHLDGVF